MFYFDGSGNVQKSGRLLYAFYTRAYVFHGVEHVIYLFFSGVAKLPPINVSMFSLIS